ncbi:MAG: hypothetical protein J0H75_01910 [Rhizobiales bacterium]|nr:hypothetical protein [Hyphomicrobiales bacterium]
MARLEAGMYGSFNRPEQIVKIKKVEPRLSVGSGDRKQHAAALIDEAIGTGDLPVSVLAGSAGDQGQVPLQIPLPILAQMIRTRGGLPDRAIRPEGIPDKAKVPKELLAALKHSALYVPHYAFDRWYKSARSKRNWPSQRSSKKSRTGRPSKQNDGLRHSIIAFVNEGKWSAQQNSLASLMRLLEAKSEAPSRQTVARMLEQLYREKGDDRYRTGRRAKRGHGRSPRPGSDGPNKL